MRHQHTVLFVDDEVNILKALQRLLRSEEMNVLCASRASEALELIEKHPTQVVVTDQRMPEMSGVDLLARVRERQPDVVRMIERDVLVEVIDPASAEPLDRDTGALGELVLTSFGRTGSPLLRYRTGDLVRPMPLVESDPFRRLRGGILARTDQMLVVRGVNVFPSAIEEVVRGFESVVEHRVEVDRSEAMIELRVIIEPTPEWKGSAKLCGAEEKSGQLWRGVVRNREAATVCSLGREPKPWLSDRVPPLRG